MRKVLLMGVLASFMLAGCGTAKSLGKTTTSLETQYRAQRIANETHSRANQ